MKIRNVGGLWAQLVGLCVYSCSNICGWIKKTPLATVSCIRHVWVCQISLWCLKWQSSSLIPRPHPAFRRLHAVWKSGRGPGIFVHEWHRDRKDGRNSLIVHGRKEPRYHVNYHMYPASGRRLSYTPSIECVVSWTIHKTQPVYFANFCHFPITSSHMRKDTRLSLLFLNGKLGRAWVPG